jgi:Ca-activated chloride channel family protein
MNWLGGITNGGLLAPVGLAALVLVPVIVLMYLLKLRRTEVVIASTMLWRKSLQDLTANAPFQRLRANLLLFLQVLVVLLLAVGLARPFLRAPGIFGENQCVIIDRSGSMRAHEADGETRLDLAKATARKLIDDLRSGDRLMIVSFGEKADVLCELTDNRSRLRDAVNSILPSDGRSNVRDVMAIARSLAPNNRDMPSVVPDLQLILLSDGRLSDLAELGETTLPLKYVRVGAASENAGIVGFDVRRPETGAGAPQAFVQVANLGDVPLDTTLTLSVDGSNLAVAPMQAAPGATKDLVFELPAIESGILRAQLDVEDALDADNRADYVFRPGAHVEVLLVTEGASPAAQYFTRALGLDARVRLTTLAPKDYGPATHADLVLFNGFAPPALPGHGALVFVNAVPPLPGLSADGDIEAPPVLAPDRTHPVMRFLNPENVHIARARRLRLPEGARTLLSTQDGPLIADVSRGGAQIVVVAFDPSASDWPLTLSFPLFVQNLVNWAPRGAADEPGYVTAGKPIELMPVAGERQARITRPDGVADTVPLDAARPVYYSATEQTGIYAFAVGSETVTRAVNLLDRAESNIRPADTVQLGRGTVQAEAGQLIVNKELWPWFAAAALAVLMLEWWIYCRRAGW